MNHIHGAESVEFDLEFDLSPEDALILRSLSSTSILHSSFKRAHDEILRTIKFNRYTQAPEPNSVLVLGESGTGKSTLHKSLLARLPSPRTELEGIDMVSKIPFFHSSLPKTATPGAMAIEMLNSMGLMDKNQTASTHRIRHALKRAGTIGIMYDELHNLAGTKTTYMVEQARGWIRDLITNTGVMFVGFGTPNCEKIFLNEPQVHKRFPKILHLKDFDFSVSGSEFEMVVNTLTSSIERHASAFERFEPQRTKRFMAATYVTTGGNMHAIKMMFEKSLFNCLNGDRVFDFDLFSETADEESFYTSLARNGYELSYEQCMSLISNRKSKAKC